MSHRSFRGLASMRAGGTLLLLGTDGRVLAGQDSAVAHCPGVLPFGLQRIVERVISESQDILASGEADVTIDFPLAVRIFSVTHRATAAVAVYVERARRRTD